MNTWTTILSFTYPYEAHLAKGRLESEGIEVILKDELTVQVINLYSNAVGGVKLLVKDSDFGEARQILIEAGYIREDESSANQFWNRFDKYTSELPLIGKLMVEVRKVKHLPDNPYYEGRFQPDEDGEEVLLLEREVRNENIKCREINFY